jgi:hypothetical protein
MAANISTKETQYPKRSKMAVVSLVLGLVSVALPLSGWSLDSPGAAVLAPLLGIFIAISAIILGTTTLVKILKSSGQLKGLFFSITAIFIPLAFYSTSLTSGFIMIQRHDADVRQKEQFMAIGIALEVFRSNHGYYPPSNVIDGENNPYCGAMKLCEAILGQDLRGFHPHSKFKQGGTDDLGNQLYISDTLNVRKRPLLELKDANVYQLKHLYKDIGSFDGDSYVLCDMYTKKRHSGIRTGMPILYYKAEISIMKLDTSQPMHKQIYKAEDNLSLVRLGTATDGQPHPLAENDGEFFYDKRYKIIDQRSNTKPIPRRPSSFILISAGRDGLYGTPDDMFNFDTQQNGRR